MERPVVERSRWAGQRPIMGVRGRWAWPAGVGLAILGALFLAAAMAVFQGSPGWGYDFEAYYLAAQRWARGDGMYQSWQLTQPFRPGPFGLYLYAPPLALATVPFTLLSVANAKVVWVVLHLVALAAACALMPVPRPLRLVTFGVAAFSKPVLVDLDLGNVSILVTFLLVVVWRWLDRPLGAIALAVAMSVRPTLGILVAWSLLRRRWRPVVWTAMAGLVLVASTLPFVGLGGYTDFLTVLRNVSHVTGVTNNLDLGSTALRLGLGPLVAQLALYGGYVVAIVASLLSLRRDAELSFVVTIGATLLLAPLLWDHYLAALLIPGAFLIARGRSWGLLLPLSAWAPPETTGLLAIAATLLPFLAPRPPTTDAPSAIAETARRATAEPAVGY